MSKCKSLIGTLIIVGFIFSIIGTGYCVGAGTFHAEVSGRLVGTLKVYAETSADHQYQPIYIHNGNTYSGHTKFTDEIPLDCKWKTIRISQDWWGLPKNVGAQIDVYTGGDITFEAPLKSIGKGGSRVSITYKNVTHSGDAGAWIRWTPK